LYGVGCDIHNQKEAEQITRIKSVKPEKAEFSFIYCDLSHLSEYAGHVPNSVFKLMKRNLPGPFTFDFDSAHLSVEQKIGNTQSTICNSSSSGKVWEDFKNIS
jgi:tRNA A37 threonylcarbamoyladenosine synthetase subunit TsaC/SUA5/YrdC